MRETEIKRPHASGVLCL